MMYSCTFIAIATHDMPCMGPNGVVREIKGNVVPSLKPPKVKCPLGIPKKKCKDKGETMCSRGYETSKKELLAKIQLTCC